MNARVVAALMFCTGSLSFAAGYGWQRETSNETRAEQILSRTDQIASDVVNIRDLLSSDASQCPNATTTPTRSNDAPNNLQQTTAEANRSLSDVAAESRQRAEVIVMSAVAARRWTENDVRELRLALDGLPAAQKQAIVAPLLQAINAQQIALEIEHGGLL